MTHVADLLIGDRKHVKRALVEAVSLSIFGRRGLLGQFPTFLQKMRLGMSGAAERLKEPRD